MFDRDTRPLVLVAIGVLLVLNPVYLFPNGVPIERTYALDGDRTDDPTDVILYGDQAGRIEQCHGENGPHESRACAFEGLVGSNGTLRLENTTLSDGVDGAVDLSAHVDYVYLESENQFYEPGARAANGSVVLSLDPVTADAVAANVSVPYESAPESVQRAVDTGDATTTLRLPSQYRTDRDDELYEYVGTVGKVVEKNGTHYHVRSGLSSAPLFAPILYDAARIVGVLAGLFLLYRAVRRQRAVVTDSDSWDAGADDDW